MQAQLPNVIVHNAVTLDGKTEGFEADQEQFYELAQQWAEDVTLAGSATMLKAEATAESGGEYATVLPQEGEDFRPVLCVVDTRGRLKSWHLWKRAGLWRDFVSVCSATTPSEHLAYLSQNGIKIIKSGQSRCNLREVLAALKKQFGAKNVRVESGGELNSLLIKEGLCSVISLLVHPVLSSDAGFRTFYLPSGFGPELQLESVKKLRGGLIWLCYNINNG